MRLAAPGKTLIPAPPVADCSCNTCPHMKRNTMQKLYVAMKYEMPEVILPEQVIRDGRASIDRMLEISKEAGL